MVAIETLGRWGGPEQVHELKAFIAAGVGAETGSCDRPFCDSWEHAAAERALKVLLPLLPDRLLAASGNEPTVESMEEAQLALRNPSWTLQKAAIEALERWGGAGQVAWLQSWWRRDHKSSVPISEIMLVKNEPQNAKRA